MLKTRSKYRSAYARNGAALCVESVVKKALTKSDRIGDRLHELRKPPGESSNASRGHAGFRPFAPRPVRGWVFSSSQALTVFTLYRGESPTKTCGSPRNLSRSIVDRLKCSSTSSSFVVSSSRGSRRVGRSANAAATATATFWSISELIASSIDDILSPFFLRHTPREFRAHNRTRYRLAQKIRRGVTHEAASFDACRS
jgi:hypothetical protein